MERGNHLLLRLIVSFEIAILYTLIFLLSNHNKEIIIENPTTYQEDIDNLEKEILFYNNIEEETNKLYEEYTDNINKLENMIVKKETKAKIAYLTFDDGPYDQTQKYLDVLKKK